MSARARKLGGHGLRTQCMTGECEALFMSGYARKLASYASVTSRCLGSLDFLDVLRTQCARISAVVQ